MQKQISTEIVMPNNLSIYKTQGNCWIVKEIYNQINAWECYNSRMVSSFWCDSEIFV